MIFFVRNYLRFAFILAFLLNISSCQLKFGREDSYYSYKQKQKRKKNEALADIVGSNRKIEHKKFGDWENKYLNDIKFEIFIDSNGSRIGVVSDDDEKDDEFTKKIKFSKISTKDPVDLILKEIESKYHNLPDDKNLIRTIVQLDKDYINDKLSLTFEVKNQKIKQITEDGLYSPKNSGKIIGKNNKIKLSIADFDDLKNWNNDKMKDAILSFMKSCDVFGNRGNSELKTKNLSLSTANKWYSTCQKIKNYTDNSEIDDKMAKSFFEENFVPIKVYQGSFGKFTDRGIFTGYYELDLEGSKEKSWRYPYPVYALPKECKNSKCATRRQIYDGKLNGRDLELAWAKSYIDIFFMQIQGSGVVMFDDDTFARVGFAGTNRRSGANVFKYMKKKCLPKCNANLTEMIEWFEVNPKEGMNVLAQSDSYVFFRKLDNNGDGAVGAQGIPLIPSRSIAVDNEMIPYGVPIWMQTHIPVKKLDGTWLDLNRLVVAQDTGDAIVGAIRADIFFGHGTKAKYLAEKTKFDGSYYLLVPKNIVNDIKVH